MWICINIEEVYSHGILIHMFKLNYYIKFAYFVLGATFIGVMCNYILICTSKIYSNVTTDIQQNSRLKRYIKIYENGINHHNIHY